MFENLFKRKIDYNNFVLMYKDKEVAEITAYNEDVKLKKVYDQNYFPTIYKKENQEETSKDLRMWMRSRCMPGVRTNVDIVMKTLCFQSTWKLSCAALGISLNDQYWYRPKGVTISWDEINPYKNGFSSDLGDILFDPTKNTINTDIVSPDATTTGVDVKRWILDKQNNAYLIKANVNCEQVACNEKLASEICKRLGIDAVNYDTIRKEVVYKDETDSFCNKNCLFAVSKNFCDENHRFITAHTYKNYFLHMREKDFVHDVLLSKKFKQDLGKMIVLDYLLSNEDRHYNNFGFLFDENGNAKFAPIYDSGNSMFYMSDISEIGHISSYSSIAPTYEEAMALFFTEPSDFDWYDPLALEGISAFFKVVMQGTNIDQERRQRLCEYLEQRVRSLNHYIDHFKSNYRDIDEIVNKACQKGDENSLGYKIENGQVVLTTEKAINECKHLLETKQIKSIKQYPAYLNSKNIER